MSIPPHPNPSHSARNQHQPAAARPADLRLKPQEIPTDDPASQWFFRPSPDKPFIATTAALDTFGTDIIIQCLRELRAAADRHHGIDYLQVFESSTGERLWFIEDGPGGAITALLPDDY
jgi:hypothetical protein